MKPHKIGAGMTDQDCFQAAGKWIPYAHSAEECAVSGYIWGKSGGNYTSGTMACCSEWRGALGDEECIVFSHEVATEAACTACSGRWLSVFKYELTGFWGAGFWGKKYAWKTRTLEKKNSWTTDLNADKLAQELDTIQLKVQATPTKNYAQCRVGTMISILHAIATNTKPVLKSGDAHSLPGATTCHDVGGSNMCTDANSTTSETMIGVNTVSASGTATGGATSSTPRMMVRRLAATNTDPSTFPPSCWTLVNNDVNKPIGQLVGDCIAFAPSPALSSTVKLCLPQKDAIQRDADFTDYDFCTFTNNVGTALSTTITLESNGNVLCGNVQASATYCPCKRFATFAGGGVPTKSNACTQMSDLAASITAAVTTVKNSADYQKFLNDLGFVVAGAQPQADSQALIGEDGTVVTNTSSYAATDTAGSLANQVAAGTTTTTPRSTLDGLNNATAGNGTDNNSTSTDTTTPGEENKSILLHISGLLCAIVMGLHF